jgi:hypothetical protein
VFINVLLVLDQFVLELLLQLDVFGAGLWQIIYRAHHEVEAGRDDPAKRGLQGS